MTLILTDSEFGSVSDILPKISTVNKVTAYTTKLLTDPPAFLPPRSVFM